MLKSLSWTLLHTAQGFGDLIHALAAPALWLDWTDKTALMRFVYYGGSVELFFVVFDLFVILTCLGLWRHAILWGYIRAVEAFGNATGRIAAWAGLLMVLQQVLIIFLQRIFRVSDISFGPFGTAFTQSLGWFSEELKLYNALIVALCCAYTFIQGGHVRVDLVYGAVGRRTKKIIDAAGALILMVPVLVMTWMYAWFFLWRHLITPKVSASDDLDLLMRKAAILRWNVETVSFSPSGFNGYFLFKILIVAFAGMMLLQATAFFYRNLLELLEGESADGRFHDSDRLDAQGATVATP